MAMTNGLSALTGIISPYIIGIMTPVILKKIVSEIFNKSSISPFF